VHPNNKASPQNHRQHQLLIKALSEVAANHLPRIASGDGWVAGEFCELVSRLDKRKNPVTVISMLI